MSLINAHTQKNRNTLASHATCSTLCTHMESTENDYEWEIINTQTNSQGGFKGINSVMGLKKNKHGEHKLIITTSALLRVLFHTSIWCDFDKFVNVFCVFSEPAERWGLVRKRAERTTRRRPFCIFQLQKASFVAQWEATTSHRWKSPFAGETWSDQPLWHPASHHTSRFDFIQK